MDSNLTSTLISTIAGFVGVIAGGTISWYVGERKTRLQNTLDLQREWQSEGMAVIRMKADKLLRDNPGKDLLHLELQDTPENYSNILRILTFYQRLYMMIRYRQVNLALTPELFGKDIVWWHVNCFRDRLPNTWIMRNDWFSLYTWLEKHSGASMSTWIDAAERARKHREPSVETGD
ncbi:hypothetical protein [Thermomonas sp. HDW16]|uniref:hypothetical protein n=1 Tax=Thermomonas sp. HDW16 TaxID=2714945 RepID=UPI00140E8324|nr:hypothetical protein [Thermomonas sp. HDW16]QIL19417.1 hypothetical protein G7079_00955 [Thermomonas sp. HDW16]